MDEPVVIIGGGPAGSACAIWLARAGIRSIIIERETFPRFHIGESLTGESGVLLREMGLEDRMMAMGYPIKHGIRIFGPSGARSSIRVPIKRRSPAGLESTFSWQVRRSTFDAFLLDTARELGTRVINGRALHPVRQPDGRVTGIALADGVTQPSRILIDATGQNTFFCHEGLTGPKEHGHFARQIAVYSHFVGAIRDEQEPGNTLTFFRNRHQWSWFIPIDDRVDSIGFVVPTDYFRAHDETPLQFLERELREFTPELARRVRGVERVEEVRTTANYSYHIREFSGPGWLCVGDAHRFIDPLFSFGVNIALAEARQAARQIAAVLQQGADDTTAFAEFVAWSERGTDICQALLDGCWDASWAFAMCIRDHEDDFIDMLSGRVWDGVDYAGLRALQTQVAARAAASAAAPAAAANRDTAH